MQAPPMEAAFSEWVAADGSFRVQWDLLVVDDIRQMVVDNFYRLPHGGLEVGGILYGESSEGLVRIKYFRPFELSYAQGPGFRLTPEDKTGIYKALEAPLPADGPALTVVGWFRSRNRTAICLDDSDAEVFQEFFPHDAPIALIFKPVRLEPTWMALYVREAGTRIEDLSPVLETRLQPLKRPRRTSEPSAVAPTEPGDSTAHGANAAESISAPLSWKQQVAEMKESSRSALTPDDADSESIAGGGNLTTEDPSSPPLLEPVFPPSRPTWHWVALAFLCTLLLGASYWLLRDWQTLSVHVARLFEQPISLRVTEQDGQIQISWNRVAEVVQKASSARLSIVDGSLRSELVLDESQLRNGSVTYQRVSNDVQVKLAVTHPDGSMVEEIARALIPSDGVELARAETRSMRVDENALRLESPPMEEIPASDAGVPSETGNAAPPIEVAPPAVVAPPAKTVPRETRPPAPKQERVEARPRPERQPPERQPPERQPPERKAPERNPPRIFDPPAATPAAPPKPIAIAQTLEPPPVETVTQPGSALPTGRAAVPAPAPPPPPAAKVKPSVPSTGRAIWSGQLPRNGTLVISDGRANTGFVTGGFPDAPVKVSVTPAELSGDGIIIYSANPRYESGPVEEPPSQRNGWNKTTYRYDPKRAQEVQVVEAPSAQNGYRLLVRGGKRNLAVLLIDWQRTE